MKAHFVGTAGAVHFHPPAKEDVFMRRAIPIALALVLGACSVAGTTTTQTVITTTTVTSTTSMRTESTTTAPTVSFPVTLAAANGPVEIPSEPEAIVSLSPTATEMLFAIGAGGQVVAVDDQSNYPSEAPVTDLTGLSPNVEAIAGYDPDLVVVSFDPGDLIDSLDTLGIPAVLEPAATSLDDVYAQIAQLGRATGHSDGAEALTASMMAGIADAYEGADSGDELTYYFELDPTYFSVTSSTFIGELLAPLGLSNIADPADPDGYGYPQLSAEFIIGADPDIILLADTVCCGQNTESVAARPGWENLTAVAQGNVISLNDDFASRWGPRVVDLVEAVGEAARKARNR
jgi:iron complex transport system substrate-binding protein